MLWLWAETTEDGGGGKTTQIIDAALILSDNKPYLHKIS